MCVSLPGQHVLCAHLQASKANPATHLGPKLFIRKSADRTCEAGHENEGLTHASFLLSQG